LPKKIVDVPGSDEMKLERRHGFGNDIIFLDGLWGTGKSLLNPIISGMARVEKTKIESIYEYISWLFSLKKIEKEAALWLLRSYADCSQYHNLIGREVNLRWADDTGLRNVPDKLLYLSRLFGGEGDSKASEINDKNIAFSVMSHMLMLTPELLVPAFGKRVKVIEMVRHPLYLVSHFASYLERFEGEREFTMSYYYEDVKVPWFVDGWEAEYVGASSVEKAVLCITHLYPWLEKKMSTARSFGLSLLDLSFEEVVFETTEATSRIENFLGRSHHPKVASILSKQMLPRQTVSQGRGHMSYGWKQTDKPERQVYEEQLQLVRSACSLGLQSEFYQLIHWYNRRYPSVLADYAVE
jgi:hypothetical protein